MVHGLGEKLKRQRELLKLSQKDVALAIGVSSSVISNYESSERVPSVENLMALANIYKCSIDYLVGIERDSATLDVSHLSEEQVVLLKRFIMTLNG